MAMAAGRYNRADSPRRWFAAKATAACVGAATCALLGGAGLGWWWDGFWLALLGMLFGQAAGLALGSYSLGQKSAESDAPLVLGNAAGIALMAALWLCLPTGAVEILGHIARAVGGAAAGWLAVLVLEPYEPVAQEKSRV
jgi:hypothetical protein